MLELDLAWNMKYLLVIIAGNYLIKSRLGHNFYQKPVNKTKKALASAYVSNCSGRRLEIIKKMRDLGKINFY